MTWEEYQLQAQRTADTTLDDTLRRQICALGLIGEVGEVAELIKHWLSHGEQTDAAIVKAWREDASTRTTGAYSLREALQLTTDEYDTFCLEGSHPNTPEGRFKTALTIELGDVCWYLAEAAQLEGVEIVSHGGSADILGLAYAVADVAGVLMVSDTVNPDLTQADIDDMVSTGARSLACIASASSIAFEDVLQANVDKLRKRHPDGFSVEASRGRNKIRGALPNGMFPCHVEYTDKGRALIDGLSETPLMTPDGETIFDARTGPEGATPVDGLTAGNQPAVDKTPERSTAGIAALRRMWVQRYEDVYSPVTVDLGELALAYTELVGPAADADADGRPMFTVPVGILVEATPDGYDVTVDEMTLTSGVDAIIASLVKPRKAWSKYLAQTAAIALGFNQGDADE